MIRLQTNTRKITYLLFSITALLMMACSNPDADTPTISAYSPFDVTIVNPSHERDFSFHNQGTRGTFENPSQAIHFKGKVVITPGSASVVPYQLVHVRWISDLDGVLFDGTPNSSFDAEMDHVLSKGIHNITLEAYALDAPQTIYRETVKVTNVIALEATTTERSVRLNWSKYEGSGFISYLIYRENSEPIIEINDINTLTYEAMETASLGDEHPYQVVAKTSNVTELMGSNIVNKSSGNYLYIPHVVSKMIKDPLRHKIYGIIDTGYNNDGTYGLIIIDADSFTVSQRLLINHKFTDLDMDAIGNTLYLSEHYTNYITKINLNNMTVSGVNVTTGGYGTAKVEVGGNNLLYCLIDPPFSSGGDYIVVNMTTGTTWQTSYPYNAGDIEFNTVTDRLYIGESDSSSSRLLKMNYTGSTFVVDNDFPHFPGGLGYAPNFLLQSEDQTRLFYDNYEFDNSLNVVREFPNGIHACSPNKLFITDYDKVYRYNDLSVVFAYPPFPQNDFLRMALFMDDHTLFVAKPYTSNDEDPDYTYLFKFTVN